MVKTIKIYQAKFEKYLKKSDFAQIWVYFGP